MSGAEGRRTAASPHQAPGFTAEELAGGVRIAAARVAALESMLNEADGKLGDGDTGGMLRRLFDALAARDLSSQPDMGAAFSDLARAAISATGSSLGTLLATALLTLAKESRGETSVPWARLGESIGKAADAMMARGRSQPGDKTVVDALLALAEALDGAEDAAACRRKAPAAVRGALEAFRDRPCRMGRARMFGEKSVGIDDPGMLACTEIVEALCAAPSSASRPSEA